MTSFARPNTDGGTVRPRAFAVFRLMTSSNLVGCSTGRSDGMAPFKIHHFPLGHHRFWPGVTGLINAELAASRQHNLGQHPPTWVLHRTAYDAAVLHLCDERLDVVAHQKELVNAVLIRRVHRHFCGRKSEDQPSSPHVDVG